MIKIKSLFKTYRSKKNKTYAAIDNLSLTLPEQGLVFLLGKSGSGKSTLLNLIGGLDSATSGSIMVDGKDITTLSGSELTNYRSERVGFVFQDYCLIDELTVFENISTALTINKKGDKNTVTEALKTVGLSGYEEKYPLELSGGERQRVAIARAIIKKPHIILADEPTGNLDFEATESIFHLLSKLSRDRLVFVVSHDVNSAFKYADRIIKLENGKIVADESRNLGNSDAKPQETSDKCSVSDKKSSVLKNQLAWLFLKSKLCKITLNSFMVALIAVVLMLSQTLVAFDHTAVMKNEFKASSPDSVFLTKTLDSKTKKQIGTLKKVANSFPEVEETDIDALQKAGYSDKIYPVLKCNINISQSLVSAGMATNIFEDSLYVTEPLGIMIATEELIEKKYGKLEYLAKAENFHPTGVILTDYLADIILQNNMVSDAADYDSLIGEYHWGNDKSAKLVARGYINGIIRTDYKGKYKNIFSSAEKYGYDYIKETLPKSQLLSLMDDVHSKYGFCYSFNPNFINDAVTNPSWNMVWHYALQFGNDAPFTANIPQVRRAQDYKIDLDKNEVMMEMTLYNKIFGTEYTKDTIEDFVPHAEKLSHYLYSKLEPADALFSREVTICGLFTADDNGFSGTFIAGEDIYAAFAQSNIYTTGVYLDNGSQIATIVDTASELGFVHDLILNESLQNVSRIVDVFVPIFNIMTVFLYVAIVLILMNFATKMIKDKMKEIGILKALGAKNRTIGAIFGLQILLIAVLTAFLSVIGYWVFVNEANYLLVDSLNSISSNKIIPDLTYFTFEIGVAAKGVILIFALAIISYVVPMIRIKLLDPLKIINGATLMKDHLGREIRLELNRYR